MRSTDERISEVLEQTRAREAVNRRRRRRVASIGGGTLAVIIVAAVGVGMSSLAYSGSTSAGTTFGLMGSVFASGSALGYVVVGLLGIALGSAVTLLACRLGRARDEHATRTVDGNSVHTLPKRANEPAKDQVAKIPSKSLDTISPNRADSDRFAKEESTSDAESVKP